MPNILDNEELYNVIVLGGKTSPGKVTLSGHNRKVTWDVQAGPFLNGAATRFKYILPIEFTASFYLLRDVSQGIDDFETWPAFLTLINSTISSPRTPAALDIYHPDLASNDIKSVVKAEVGGTVYDEKGGATIAVKFQEYRPPKKWEGAPKSKPANNPNADLNAEVKALTPAAAAAAASIGSAIGKVLVGQGQNTPFG